jgi:hypothetical protein
MTQRTRGERKNQVKVSRNAAANTTKKETQKSSNVTKAPKSVIEAQGNSAKQQTNAAGVQNFDRKQFAGVYDGEMSDGQRSGNGVLRWADGSTYKGDFFRGLRHGVGEYIMAGMAGRGRKYTGGWYNGVRCGEGTEVWPNGDRYVGEFDKGKSHGVGVFSSVRGKYEGKWKAGVRDGLGTMVWAKKRDKYIGQWVNDERHGQGKYVRGTDGTTYDGAWHRGRKSGYGVEVLRTGERHEGTWRDDQKHGEGVIRYPNGRTRTGEWIRGERTKWLTAEKLGGGKR